MDQAFVTSFIRSAVYLALLVLVGLTGFFARQWFKSQEKAQEEREKAQAVRDAALQDAMANLTNAVSELNKTLIETRQTQARHDERIEDHDEQLKGIWKGENCLNPHCPYRNART